MAEGVKTEAETNSRQVAKPNAHSPHIFNVA